MTVYRDFDTPDAFTTAALGRPGHRVFLIQVRGEGEVVTLKCEKQQVAAIAHFVRELLADLPDGDIPLPDALDLIPLPHGTGAGDAAFDFVVGPIGVAYDRDLDRVVVQLDEMVPSTKTVNPTPMSSRVGCVVSSRADRRLPSVTMPMTSSLRVDRTAAGVDSRSTRTVTRVRE